VRPTSKMPPLLAGLSRIDLTNCSEDEARSRLIKGVDMPAPPQLKPAFEKIEGEPPDTQHTGSAEKPTFAPVSDGVPRWLKLSAAIAGIALAASVALIFFLNRGSMLTTTGPQSPIVQDTKGDVRIDFNSPPGASR